MTTKMPVYLFSPTEKEGAIHLPMITFTLCEDDVDFLGFDLLMFTSSQAVKSAQTLNPEWKHTPCLAIGEATAKTIESLGGKVLYAPKRFYGQALAEDIVSKFKDKSILYLRPKVVSFDVKSFLDKEGVALTEKIIYETSCVRYEREDRPLKNAILIFTSPSTIHCFLKNFDWDESYTAIVIGESTKKHLPENARYAVADKPLIDACMDKAKEILTPNRL